MNSYRTSSRTRPPRRSWFAGWLGGGRPKKRPLRLAETLEKRQLLTAGPWTVAPQISRAAFLADGVSAPAAIESNPQQLFIAPQSLTPQAGERLRVRLEAQDLDENTITSITPGGEFILRAYVDDLRATPEGVFSAYVDVTYDSNLVSSQASAGDGVANEAPYTQFQSGNAQTAGLINEAGGASTSSSPLGDGERLLFTVLMRANTAGSATFTLDPADTEGFEFLLYGEDNALPLSEVEFVNTTLTIGTPQPSMSISDVVVTEGDDDIVIAEFTVTLSAPSSQIVSFDYATSDGTATAGADYEAITAGSDFFPPNSTTRTISIPVLADQLAESGETFFVTLTNPENATIADAVGQATIIDDDSPAPTISISDATLTEGNSGTANMVFNVTLSNAVANQVTVDFSTIPGSATAGTDYQLTTGTVTFAPGETTKTIAIPIVGDTVFEEAETFAVALANSSGPMITDNQGLGTIQNDDAAPAITIADVTQNEGNSGTTNFVFTLTRSPAIALTSSVQVAVVAGTATAGVDFTELTETITFAANETQKTFTVLVAGDTTDEGDETFVVNLTNPVNATLPDNQATGTIVDDDNPAEPPSLSINDVTVTEGNSGLTDMVFTVTRTGSLAAESSVTVATAPNTALATFDFEAQTTTLTFAANEATKTVTIKVVGDTVDEENETFFVNLLNPVGATISDAQGVGTITDDDVTLPTLSINDVTQAEGNSGNTQFQFTVTLSAASATPVTVNFNTTAGSAFAGEDFIASNGTVTFAAGETTKTITIEVVGDTSFEQAETFSVTLSQPSGATLADGTGLGTITNDDEFGPSFSVDDITVAEGDSGTTNATFTVTLSQALSAQATVNFATSNGTALAPADYTSSSGTLTFAAGETSKTVTVVIVGDTLDEENETVKLLLSNAVGAAIADAEGVATITDNDPTPTISINDRSVDEQDTGTRGMVFTVTLSAASGRTVTVDFATADGTAKASEDYNAATGTLTFAPGVTERTINVTILNDTKDEANEKFTVNLSNAAGATIADSTGEGTITDNDPEPTMSIADLTVTEGDDGTKEVNFAVSLSAVSGLPVIVSYATAAGTALVGSDFQSASGDLTFNAGESTKTITVRIVNDRIAEGTESFTVTLSNPFGATITDGTATGTIEDNDAAPSLSIDSISLTEGESGTQNATFTVTLSGASAQTVTVNFATADGTATAGVDYNATSGTLTFAPGETSKTITVQVIGDVFAEANETFFVNLTNPTAATIGTGQGTATLVNNDSGPVEGEAASIAGCVFVDINGDGARGAGEQGLAGVTIQLTGTDRFGTAVNRTVLTDAAGDYFFAGLVPGQYSITQTHPADYLDGPELIGSVGGTAAADQFFLNLGAGQNGTAYNFAEMGLTPGNITRRNFIVPR